MTAHGPIRCVTCGKRIEGCATTRHDGGWVHVHTRSERCAPPHRTLAAPPTIDDLNAEHTQTIARYRARRKATP